MQNFPTISDHVIAILFGLILPVYSGIRTAKTFKKLILEGKDRIRFYIINSLFLWLITVIILINWFVQGRAAADLGITKTPVFSGLVVFLSSAFIILYILDIVLISRSKTELQKKYWTDIAPILPDSRRQLPAYIFMCITAGVCEEIIFRGFLITYTRTLFENDIPAVLIPSAVFAVAHYYQRTVAVVKIFLLSVIFGYIFLESGSLWIVMFLHFAIDLAGGLIVMKQQQKEKRNTINTPGTGDDDLAFDGPIAGNNEKTPDDTGAE